MDDETGFNESAVKENCLKVLKNGHGDVKLSLSVDDTGSESQTTNGTDDSSQSYANGVSESEKVDEAMEVEAGELNVSQGSEQTDDSKTEQDFENHVNEGSSSEKVVEEESSEGGKRQREDISDDESSEKRDYSFSTEEDSQEERLNDEDSQEESPSKEDSIAMEEDSQEEPSKDETLVGVKEDSQKECSKYEKHLDMEEESQEDRSKNDKILEMEADSQEEPFKSDNVLAIEGVSQEVHSKDENLLEMEEDNQEVPSNKEDNLVMHSMEEESKEPFEIDKDSKKVDDNSKEVNEGSNPVSQDVGTENMITDNGETTEELKVPDDLEEGEVPIDLELRNAIVEGELSPERKEALVRAVHREVEKALLEEGELANEIEEDDEDPNALTIDTGKWSGGEEKKSDDDVDPAALTIDTKDTKNEPDSDQEPSLTIAINSRLKKVIKKPKVKGTRRRAPKQTTFPTDQQRIQEAQKIASQEGPKVPRKVYMCSACGSYFENWNLFLHMKEMHKRNICLHCLGMFSQASKLTQHLATKHGVVDQILDCADQLSLRFPGPQLLLCCRCDRMCTELDFESHTCSTVCSHCGLSGTHYPTCRLAPPPAQRPMKTPRRRVRKVKKSAPALPPPPTEAPSPADDLSPTTFNEKMLQLYRGNRSFSTLESIEETINQVVMEGVEPIPEEEEEEEPVISPEKEEPVHETIEEPEPEEPAPEPVPEEPVHVEKSESDSDGERLTIELEPKRRNRAPKPEPMEEPSDSLVLAGEETPFTCVPLPEPLDTARVPIAMKLFLRATSLTCVYCAHARKIAVNAKQLALHQLSQHRYITIAESSTNSEKIACHEGIVVTMKETLQSLEDVYFNAYGFDSSDKSAWRSADRVYECFHCSIITADLREFSQHNRKQHCNELRKSRHAESHLCIMCKTRFLTYSELLCHLCCGLYVPGRIIDPNCKYRCYCCDIDPLPSSFRLMVHLRLTHTACDMCFTLCDSQSALSSHVQRHKSISYCYACGLTYETRMELSKHIFWKHGAESVTCKRCLQKKWRHAYHFCLPAQQFPCETCGSYFKTTATLRVHQRLHAGDLPHACEECEEKFVSRKLLAKHAKIHSKEEVVPVVNGSVERTPDDGVQVTGEKKKQKEKKPKKDLRELFDLPPVNLSESDDSSGDEATSAKKDDSTEIPSEPKPTPLPDAQPTTSAIVAAIPSSSTSTVPAEPAAVWDGVLASLEVKTNGRNYPPDSPFYNLPLHRISAIMLADHDYCRPVSAVKDESRVGLDHDYCNNGLPTKPASKHSPRKSSSKRNRTRSSSSDSSSSSDGSCSCGSSCSCSSTSSTESASSGEQPKPKNKTKAMSKADKRKGKGAKKAEPEPELNVGTPEIRINESDLETDEPVTDDEEFYEQNPALRASEVLRLNRSMLVDKLENVPSPSQSALQSHLTGSSPRKKSKSKKRQRAMAHAGGGGEYADTPRPYIPMYNTSTPADESSGEGGAEGRRPRRKRVPLKFYGFSSGDEEDMPATPPRKRERTIEHNTTIPATPTTTAAEASPQPEPSNLWNPPSWRPPPVPPRVHPIKIRTGALKQTFAKSNNGDGFHIKRAELGGFHVNGANSGQSGEKNEKLYCFCQCPYDEVSEMIACDAHDCVIEWFHFECVGIMDPPKGKWYCPDCKKKAAAASEMMSIPLR